MPTETSFQAKGNHSLRRNFSWTLFGSGFYSACQWGVVVVLAKLGRPEAVGQFALALGIVTPVMMLCSLQMRQVLQTDVKREFSFADYLTLRLITTLAAFALAIGIAHLSGLNLTTIRVVTLVALMKSTDGVADIFYGSWQRRERMDMIARSLILNGTVSTTLLAIAIWRTESLVLAVAASAVGSAAALVYTLASPSTPTPSRLRPMRSLRTLWPLVRVSAPLGVVSMLISLNQSMPRYFIERSLGSRQLSVFAAISYFVLVGSMIVGALSQSASARLARYYAAGQRQDFVTLCGRMVGIGALLGVAGIGVAYFFGGWILRVMYRPEYAQSKDVFTWTMVAAAIGYCAWMLGCAITAARVFREQLPLFALTAIVSAVGCMILAPSHGLLGAAWATVIAAAFQLAGSLVIGHRTLRRMPASMSPSEVGRLHPEEVP
ncbi:MAG TPA: lipopolysaccharide biosynthesis protein [Armatimonadota bacterium]|jgi:O-antigen/teichoic acid export membrane protein